MTSEIIFDDEIVYGPARVCIIGAPGTGKTSLAGTFPNPYVLSLEHGAALVKALRKEIAPNDGAFDEVKNEVALLQKSPFDKEQGGLWVTKKNRAGVEKKFLVKTLVIDSIDAIQQSKRFALLGSRPSFEMRDWGRLFDLIMPVALMWNSLPIHVVIVAHVRQEEPEEQKLGLKTVSLQGAFKDHFPRWFRYILHLSARENDARVVYTRPTITSDRYQIVAKDTYRAFANLPNPAQVPHVEGVPTSSFADAICALHKLDGSSPDPTTLAGKTGQPAPKTAPQSVAGKPAGPTAPVKSS